ncbi:hypothetical protein [Pseudomonas sp. LY10J]|uniref:hypothetical protein n=1 Tax=Pseudomonas TaxID=286 RepID=UPI003B633DD5
MAEVVTHSTQYLSDQDLNAIAVYLKSLAPANSAPALRANDATAKALFNGDVSKPGAQVYVDTRPMM